MVPRRSQATPLRDCRQLKKTKYKRYNLSNKTEAEPQLLDVVSYEANGPTTVSRF